ncbi:hypothetical protein EW146_g9910, partial [Bondarzewia mesenterica]
LQWAINFLTVRSWWDAHNSTLGVILGLSLTGAITQFTKITVGRPRPDLISRCNLAAGTVDPTFGLSSAAICNQSDTFILEDGFRSFPSGHSSLSFAGLGFLSFYLAGKMHLFDKRGHATKAWIALTPLSGAALVAISRTMDYRHHWHDVLIGAILGLTTAYFAYRQYYPSLASELSHRPYSPRIKREEDLLPIHHRSSAEAMYPSTSRIMSQYGDGGSEGDEVELVDGTVHRGGPGPLEEVWKGNDDRRDEVQSAGWFRGAPKPRDWRTSFARPLVRSFPSDPPLGSLPGSRAIIAGGAVYTHATFFAAESSPRPVRRRVLPVAPSVPRGSPLTQRGHAPRRQSPVSCSAGIDHGYPMTAEGTSDRG